MQNAGANFTDEPLVIDDNLITSRQPSDLAIFTTAILKRLNLTIKKVALPDETQQDAEWWKLAEQWGGSTQTEIADGLNTAIRGERYAVGAFEHYAEKATDTDLRAAFNDIRATKERHIKLLEAHLATIGEEESFQAAGSGAYATLKSWLQSSDDTALLQRALGDLQTGVVDAYNLRNSLTDPASARIFDEIEVDTAKDEQHVADLLLARTAKDKTATAKPTTGAAVSA